MLRTLAGIGIALALVGSAHAQDQQVTVYVQGKSPAALRAEIYRAAETVCATPRVTVDAIQSDCVEETYVAALHQAQAGRRQLTTRIGPTAIDFH